MAKQRQVGAEMKTNELKGLGESLAHVAARLEAWKRQREEIAAEVRAVFARSRQLLEELGDGALGTSAASAQGRRKGKGGRPKGYKASAATKAKLRAAWKRRKAATAAGRTSQS